MPDENNADSSTALDTASDASLAANDFTRYQELENARDVADKTGKALPEIPPPSKPSEPAADPESATRPQEKKPKTGEDRKAELHAEIQELLKKRAELKGAIETPGEKKAADPPPAEKPKEPEKAKAPTEPKLEDFATYAEYQAADRKYIRELVKFEARETVNADKAEAATKAANKTIEDRWHAKIVEAKAEFPDYEAVAFSKDTPISAAMDGFILKSPAGARVLYRLGENNSAEGKRIFALDAYDQVEELMKIRDSLPAAAEVPPPVKKHTAAPPPATDIGARNTEPADAELAALNRGDTETYMRLANAREIKARRAA